MSKLTEKLREVRVFNSYDFYGNQPYIVYDPTDTGRGGMSARWMVFKRGENLSQAWYDNGGRAFLRGVKEWTRDPFGSYGPSDFVKTRIKELLVATARK